MFKIGERVVHPQYGVGHVVKLDEREFEPGVTRRYYEISIPGGSTVWVPVDLATSGLRKLTAKSQLTRCSPDFFSCARPALGGCAFKTV